MIPSLQPTPALDPSIRDLRSNKTSARRSLTAGLLGLFLAVPLNPVAHAGDILRGGAPANQRNPALGSQATSAAADQARTNARDALTRTTQAIQAVQNMQNAAKLQAAAVAQDRLKPGLTPVSNGLSANGLNFTKVASGANAPTQTIANGRYNVTVKQTAQQAFLEWQKFNVSRATTLYFDQSAGGTNAGQWIAFNQVKDPSGEPSQIMGQINGQGQVYILNANGILFGGTSQVNLHGLVASSLPINPNLTSRGLLNNPDVQFLFSALPQAAGAKGSAAVDPFPTGSTPPASGRIGDVEVMAGAQLTAPTNADHVGGRIALIGANVKNAGRISTPDGQTILAAGLQVGLTAHSSKDPSLRGLDVWVGAVQTPTGYSGPLTDTTAYAGTVTNTGWIDAPRGNITLAGKTINQMAVLTASTSVSLNGRIDLDASYNAVSNPKYDATNASTGTPFLFKSAGNVTLGPNSVTRILPEWTSADKVVGTQLALNSQINMRGNVIHLDDNAMVYAPNATVNLRSGRWDYVEGNGTPKSSFIYNGGQVYLDKGAWINVSGSTDAAGLMADNIVTLQLRGAEFANSVFNRDNPVVRGVDITLDLRQQGVYNGFAWAGTPLADATGYLGLVQRDVGQLTGAGGTVNINSGGSVIMQQGSGIDVSGGFVNYAGGLVKTTRLTYREHIYDISQATPDRVYDGVYTGQFTTTSSRWGVTKTYTVPFMLGEHFEPGYTYGYNGGAINISAPSMALDGTLRGNTVNGPRQRDLKATPSSLSLAFEAQKSTSPNYFTYSPTPPTVLFQSGITQQAANAFALDSNGNAIALRDDRVKKVVLSADALKEGGFGSVTVKNVDGNITVAEGEKLDLGPRGSLTLSGANVDIEGSIVAPGGSVTLNAYNLSPNAVEELKNSATPSTPASNKNRGLITLGGEASISTAGLIVDDRLSAPDPFTLPLALNSGSVSLNGFSASLEQGSRIDVSGGVRVDPFGKRTYGDAGSISIITGRDLNLTGLTGGTLELNGSLRGIAGMGAKGGSLTLQAMQIQIGGFAAPGAKDALWLQPSFFSQGGFSSFNLTGIRGLSIEPGTVIAPVVKNTVAVLYGDNRDTARFSEVVLPEGMRYPVSLSFNATGISDDFSREIKSVGTVSLGENALIKAGPMGSVSFKGDAVSVLGDVFAPGGVINITGAKSYPTNNPNPPAALSTVYVGPNATLSTAGTVVLTPDAYGRRTGFVLPGGAINVTGNIVMERGAVLDVSGTSGDLDIAPAYLGLTVNGDPLTGGQLVPLTSGLTTPLYSLAVMRTHLESNGGSIVLKGSQMLFTHASLRGEAGGPTAAGGTLSISSGRFYPTGATVLPSDTNLVVSQTGSNVPGTFFAPGSNGIGKAIAMPGMGYFAANDFAQGGFDSLTLGGNVQFKGPVTLNANGYLKVATGGFLGADAAVNLAARYVAIGTPFTAPLLPTEVQNPFIQDGQPYYFAPTFGTGSLNITADLIDVGNLTLSSIGSVRMNAAHDIRGNGTFSMAGDLFMRAAQIYPTTGSVFSLFAYDSPGHKGSITFARNGTVSLPLSAAGTLNVYASEINQGGVLRAPFGVINLGWDGTGTAPKNLAVGSLLSAPVTETLTLGTGSVTSVSAIDPITGQGILIPYGISTNGTNWIDPSGVDITATGLLNKAINLAGKSLTTAAGSVIDLRGGGDVYAYRWVTGLQGTNDILGATNAFAVVPGYDASYAPFGAFNTSTQATNLGGATGYVNGSLHAGDRIWLDSGSGLNAGYYTLLPARYATMPGAFLITPQNGAPIGTFLKPDGASYVNGYRLNAYDGAGTPTLYGRFEVAPAATIAKRAQYDLFFGNSFFEDYAIEHKLTVPRLPKDSGQLVLQATTAMDLNGKVLSASLAGGRGGLVDISSPVDILIGTSKTPEITGTLVLDAAQLSSFGAESLLIGGVRTFGPDGVTVNVKTNRLTLQNDAANPLTGPEIILVANKRLTVDTNAVLKQSGSLSGSADTLLLGNSTTAGSGDGLLLRVSADPNAQIVRTNVTDASTVANKTTLPRMDLATGSSITGNAVIVDSTYATNLALGTAISGRSLSLNSGQISLELGGARAHSLIDLATDGLILTSSDLQRFQTSDSLSLLSYSSIDIYGTGTVGDASVKSLALHAGEIRGFDQGANGTVTFAAQNITLDNMANGRVPGVIVNPPKGTLAFEADRIHLGANSLQIDQYANLTLNAAQGLSLDGSGGLKMAGAITINTPVITAAASSTQSIVAGGALNITSPGGTGTVTPGLGASLTLQGTSATVDSDIHLPSGRLTVIATSGNVSVGGKLDVGGTAQTFFDQMRYTDAGTITLTSNTGNVNVTGTLNLAAQSGGGNAGTLTVNAAQGNATLTGQLFGQGGSGGRDGSFALDVKSLPTLQALSANLDSAGFTDTRSIRVRTGDVLINGTTTAHHFTLSADAGKIDVSGTVNASGTTGGTINLVAFKGLNLLSGAKLDASATTFDSAGKGGAIELETRGNSGGTISIASGSTIDLRVNDTASLGEFSGTLQLRAPQNAGATDLAVDTIGGSVLGASSIVLEGFKTYSLSGSGLITSTLRTDIFNNGTTFGSNATAIANRVLAGNSAVSVQVGAELISTGDITLGTATPGASSTAWDLSTFRFGTKQAPGVLTMRAAGNLVLYEALSDGFQSASYNALLLDQNTLLNANAQHWSYRLTAGADLTAADVHQTLASTTGSLLLGRNAGTGNDSASNIGTNAQTSVAVKNNFQVIRTGSGSIEINAAKDVLLLNQFATIYSAGTKVTDATMGGTFELPDTTLGTGAQGSLGIRQQDTGYAAQFTYAGGNVSISAGNDIAHKTQDGSGNLIADSSRQLPNNWLYRRGYVDPATGQFGASPQGEIASTAWWVDYSNFFEGAGALGGGNVNLTAGRDVANVDAVIPTNGRMPKGTPDATKLVELGGGDLRVTTGRNLDAGAYYVERGLGSLNVSGSIITNSTRTPSVGSITGSAANPEETWLPTTLFVGKSSFDVSARGDVLMGPAANVFLMPQGFNNSFWYKTYFNTYSAESGVKISSLSGDVTLREATTLPGGVGGATPMLQAWLQNVQVFNSAVQTASFYHPWLRLAESKVDPFIISASLMPSSLRVTSFSGDVNLVGTLNLTPSPTGTVDIAARGALNGLQSMGTVTINSTATRAWGTSRINLSDANPALLPGLASPSAYQAVSGWVPAIANQTGGPAVGDTFLQFIDALFAESGSTEGSYGVLQTKQALHDQSILHRNDNEPLRLYASGGSISGLTLFSSKTARVVSSADITDIAFYIQNTKSSDVSVVASGGDIIAYNASSPLRTLATRTGNLLNAGERPLAGDIQISGPGTLEVLAGRNLDLGTGGNNADGTGVGITSIGNGRNPSLPFDGANIIAAAGIGSSFDLSNSALDFGAFTNSLGTGTGAGGHDYFALLNDPKVKTLADFKNLGVEEQKRVALSLFFLVLREAGRDHNIAGSPGFGSYTAGQNAVSTLFKGSVWDGEIKTQARDIRTKSGGGITLLAPGGGLTLADSVIGTPLAPPGIITESGGTINIFTRDNVDIGIARIFTLRGGDEVIWSSLGNIAAGSSSKTVQSAPPTRVIIDPQSGDVKTDLAGLATGGGIGVLATVAGVAPGSVDLIAPLGTIDAGDAGIRATGNLNIAATAVLNASNITVGGSTAGAPSAPTVAAPNIGGLTSSSNAAAASSTAAQTQANKAATQQTTATTAPQTQEVPSIITVEVIGYGGGEEDDEELKKKRKSE